MPDEPEMIEDKSDVSIRKPAVESKNTLLYILLIAVIAMLCVLASFNDGDKFNVGYIVSAHS